MHLLTHHDNDQHVEDKEFLIYLVFLELANKSVILMDEFAMSLSLSFAPDAHILAACVVVGVAALPMPLVVLPFSFIEIPINVVVCAVATPLVLHPGT